MNSVQLEFLQKLSEFHKCRHKCKIKGAFEDNKLFPGCNIQKYTHIKIQHFATLMIEQG